MRTTGDQPQCWWGDLCVSTCGQGVAVEESGQAGHRERHDHQYDDQYDDQYDH